LHSPPYEFPTLACSLSYGVSEDTLQLFVNYGSIFFLVMSVPVAILMDRPNGFRSAVLLSTLVVLLGCILRLLARDSTFTSVILLHFSYALNALAGPIAVSAPSLLANAWFPANERGLATGIAVASNTFGLVCSYFCGPLFVAAGTMGNLMTYMYVCLALSAANGLGILLHFPSSPALPPSRSAGLYAMANQT
jgi:nitrate/nitrite transporter NarK